MSDVILDPLRCEAVEGNEEAMLDGWLVCEGERVRQGQVLGRVLLLHQPVDLRAPHDGVVEEIVVAAGERFVPGHVLARLIEF